MAGSLVTEFETVMSHEAGKLQPKFILGPLAGADERYHDLIKRGLIKPRGYTLPTIADKPLRKNILIYPSK